MEASEARFRQSKYTTEHFQNHANPVREDRRITVIAVEVPTGTDRRREVNGWANISLYGQHRRCRWRVGDAVLTHLFIRDNEMSENYNRHAPYGENAPFTAHIGAVVRETVRGRKRDDTEAYAERVLARIGPLTLTYELESTARSNTRASTARSEGASCEVHAIH